jgi:hypothetical protein
MPKKAKIMRDRKNYMIMIAMQYDRFLFFKPSLNLHPGAQWAYSMFTGIVPNSMEMTIGTRLSVSAENGCPAGHHALSGESYMVGQDARLLKCSVPQNQDRLNSWFHYSTWIFLLVLPC